MPELTPEEAGKVERCLGDCLALLDRLDLVAITPHVSLALERFREAYAARD